MAMDESTARTLDHSESSRRVRFSIFVALALAITVILTTACAESDDVDGNSTVAPTTVTSINTIVPQPTQIPTSIVAPLPTATTTSPTPVLTATTPHSTATSIPDPTSTTTPSPTNTVAPIPPTATIVPPSATSTIAPTIAPPTPEPIAPTAPPELVINQELANEGESIYSSNCSGCHSQGSNKVVGPGHANVYETAKTRVSALSPEGYLMQSITDPTAFVVPGFSPIMPSFSFFTDEQILALVEFLKTL